MTYITRAGWGAAPAEARYDLDVDDVVGVALHWPAMKAPLRTSDEVCAALRGWQRYHMGTLGWSDIGYQEAVDQLGNAYALRGLSHRSGANGDEDVNRRYGAILLVVAPGEKLTPALIRTTRNRIEAHRNLFRGSHRIKGHSDVRPEPTACPGPAITAAIRAGTFEPEKPNRVERGRQLIARGLDVFDSIPDGTRPEVEKAARAIKRELRNMPKS